MQEETNGYASLMARRTIGYSLQPGHSAKYRHRDNRELVTVTRFAYRQRWEDKTGDSGKSVYNSDTKVSEYPKIWVSHADCEIKPDYGPAFVYPVMALDIAYEPEPEAVAEAA